jgi:hypothetical protein
MYFKRLLVLVTFLLAGSVAFSQQLTGLEGAWLSRQDTAQEILLIQDGYITHTVYNSDGKKFFRARGGLLTASGNKLSVLYEFDSAQPGEVGKQQEYQLAIEAMILQLNLNGRPQSWARVDNSSAPLAGVWKISARDSDGKLQPIHQTGTRKTLKMLTGTRFQWFAIDPATKIFSGTGGGTYSFRDGTYTENIEFFSRDNSRVGTSLRFEGKLENGKWHHSGTSSKGDKIYEVWGKIGDQ